MIVTGVANVLFAAFGAYLLGFEVVRNLEPRNRIWFHEIRFLFIFIGIGVCSGVLLAFLAYFGWRLTRRDTDAISKSIKLFVAEIVYFLVSTIAFWSILPAFGSGMADPVVARALALKLALDPQLITGYPIIGVLILLWAKKQNGHSTRNAMTA